MLLESTSGELHTPRPLHPHGKQQAVPGNLGDGCLLAALRTVWLMALPRRSCLSLEVRAMHMLFFFNPHPIVGFRERGREREKH